MTNNFVFIMSCDNKNMTYQIIIIQSKKSHTPLHDLLNLELMIHNKIGSCLNPFHST